MANVYVENIKKRIQDNFGGIEKIGDGYSLFKIKSNDVFIYFRYSKLSSRSKTSKQTFFGLRKEDLDIMQGKKAFICFVWDNNEAPILFPFTQFENYFNNVSPASDGQYKTSIYFKPTGTELYLANIGKFKVDSFYGLSALKGIDQKRISVPNLSHNQIQSLVGAIGIHKGYNLWFPSKDKANIDQSIVSNSNVLQTIPTFNQDVNHIISEIDVIWFNENYPISFWEVEHSTPIYSGLLRFNDVLLSVAGVDNFNIIAKRDRENKFGREINRPTFKKNQLINKVSFIDYENIYSWHYNLTGKHYGK